MRPRLKTLPPRIKAVRPELRPLTTATERTRGNAWMKVRERILYRDCGLCQQCKREGRLTVGAEVDHILPLKQGGTDAESNLQTLCIPCHEAKTKAEQQPARRPG